MSLSTVFTFLSKAFAKISIAFSLFFVVLGAAYFYGIISDTVFNILFLAILIMLLIDVAIKFGLKQHETIYLHLLEEKYVHDNYPEYRQEIQTKKKLEQTTSESFVKDLGKEVLTKAVSKVVKDKTETPEEKKARLEKELSELS